MSSPLSFFPSLFSALVRISPYNRPRPRGVGWPSIASALQCSFSRLVGVVLVSIAAIINIPGANARSQNTKPSAAGISAHYLALPMQFEPNHGPTDATVQFLSRGPGYTLFLTPTQAVLSLRSVTDSHRQRTSNHRRGHDERAQVTQTALQMNLIGANEASTIGAIRDQPGSANYFVGNVPARWYS